MSKKNEKYNEFFLKKQLPLYPKTKKYNYGN